MSVCLTVCVPTVAVDEAAGAEWADAAAAAAEEEAAAQDCLMDNVGVRADFDY